MAIETFSWCPRINAEGEVNYRTRTGQQGDGYEQVVGDGINTKLMSFDLSFVGDDAYISAIVTFLDLHAGTKSFQWKPPLYPLGLYRCAGHKPVALGGGKYSLTATFKQSFSV